MAGLGFVPKVPGVPGIGIPGFSGQSGSSGEQSELERDFLENELARVTVPPAINNWNKTSTYSFAIGRADAADGSVNNTNVVVPGFSSNVYSLPIPPTSVDYGIPFAVSVKASNRGVVEENNGVVFRTITISGTTGFLLEREVRQSGFNKFMKNAPLPLRIASQLLPDTTSAIAGTIAQGQALLEGITGKKRPKVQLTDAQKSKTGHAMFYRLHNFLIAYAELKKNKRKASNSQDFRLLFSSTKDNISYVCTPVSFSFKKSVENPLIYRYNIVLKAWDVANSAPSKRLVQMEIPSASNTNAVKSVINTLTDARALIQSASNIINGVQSDSATMMDAYAQVVLLGKDVADVRNTAADFPNVLKTYNKEIVGSANDAFARAWGDLANRGDEHALRVIGSKEGAGQRYAAASTGSLIYDTTSPSTVQSTGETTTQTGSELGDFTNAVTAAADYAPVSEAINMDDLDLPESVQSAVDDQVEKARSLTTSDIMNLGSRLQDTSDGLAASVDMSDPVYDRTYGVSSSNGGRAPTEDDIILQASLQDAKDAALSLLSTGEILGQRDPDPFVIANDSLQDSDQMDSPQSMYAVPFLGGFTVEEMANLYLGDPDRGKEIAILNKLKPPYVDEAGFDLPIAEASGRRIVVALDGRLEIGQKIRIRGSAVRPTSRTVIDLEVIGGQTELTLDGNADLDLYSPSTSPVMNARLPGTVGTGDFVLIPSPGAPPVVGLPERPTATLNRLSAAEKVFKIDIKLDRNNDWAIGPDGDVAVSTGYDNAVQAIRSIIETEATELERHPDYGLGRTVGQKNTDVFVTLKENISKQISMDPRFQGADVTVTMDGNETHVTVVAKGANGTSLIPVDFRVGQAT